VSCLGQVSRRAGRSGYVRQLRFCWTPAGPRTFGIPGCSALSFTWWSWLMSFRRPVSGMTTGKHINDTRESRRIRLDNLGTQLTAFGRITPPLTSACRRPAGGPGMDRRTQPLRAPNRCWSGVVSSDVGGKFCCFRCSNNPGVGPRRKCVIARRC
jgi:hypothetical protein